MRTEEPVLGVEWRVMVVVVVWVEEEDREWRRDGVLEGSLEGEGRSRVGE
jgi:hypothetical protein